MQHDIIPQSDTGFHNFQTSLMKNVIDNATEWRIPSDVIDALIPLRDAWNTSWKTASNRKSRTQTDVGNKNIARTKYKAMLRPFIQAYVRHNIFMTGSNQIACGIKPRDRKPTRVQIPDTIPWLFFEITKAREIIVIFRIQTGDEGSTTLAKPKGVSRIEVAYSIGIEPEYAKDCTSIMTFSRNRHRLRDLHEEHHGKKLYCFARWVNPRNEAGQWSQRFMVIIP